MEANDIKFEVPSILTPDFIEQPTFDATKVDTTPIQEMNNSGTIVSGNIDFGNYNQPADLSYFNISKSIGQTNDSSFLKQKFSGEQTLSPYKENTLPQPKPKMTGFERMALNEASPKDFELNKSDKLYKFGKKGLAKAGDFLLGALAGNITESALENVRHKSTEKIIQALNKETNAFWKEYPWLQDGLPAIRKVKEDIGVKPKSTQEMLDILKNMTPEERAAADAAGKAFVENRTKITELGKKEKALNNITSKITPTAGAVLNTILSPIESLSNLQDKKIMRDTKIKILESLPSTLGDMSSKTDKELDNLIRIHSNEIKSMYAK